MLRLRTHGPGLVHLRSLKPAYLRDSTGHSPRRVAAESLAAMSTVWPTGTRALRCGRVILFALLASMITCVPATADDAALQRLFRNELAPLLRTYCYDCHGESDGEGGLSLAADDSADKLVKGRQHWMRAKAQLQLGSMPPADYETMDTASRDRMVELIDQLANSINCVQNPNAGKVTLRRLNRTEYRNTIRDLTGVDYSPAKDFPGDDVGYGFDTIGDVLSLPPLLMEKYLDAAEDIVGQAIDTVPPPQSFAISVQPLKLKGANQFDGNRSLAMNHNGTVTLSLEAPFYGDYTVTMVVSGDQAGDAPVQIRVASGSKAFTISIPESDPTEKTVTFRLGKKKHDIDVSFLNDFYASKPNSREKEDRNFFLHNIEVHGTERRSKQLLDADLNPNHRRLLFVTPGKTDSFESAAAAVLSRFASRAYRRPASKQEASRLVQFAKQVHDDGATFEESMQVAMQAVLVSPHFLFRVEKPRTPDAQGRMPNINEYELATRISYFLWSSMPDDELLLMAHRGELRDQSKLREKVTRMIHDRRSSRFVGSFASQWLQLRNLERADPDTQVYHGFNETIRESMRIETLMFFSELMKKNQPVTRLIDADFTYLNESLAEFYGIPNVQGEAFRLVSLKDSQRGGLLTHGSILTVTSNPTRTSPVKRGKWILDNLLNMPPAPAPPNVPELDKGPLVGSLRDRMEQHRSNPACAACHKMMDPLGFALENFDAVGQFRTRDGQDEIDASGEMPDGTQFQGASGLRELLGSQRKEQFVRCLVEKLMTYSLGRGTEYYDKCAIDRIMSETQANEFRFVDVIIGIIESDPFQKQGFRE